MTEESLDNSANANNFASIFCSNGGSNIFNASSKSLSGTLTSGSSVSTAVGGVSGGTTWTTYIPCSGCGCQPCQCNSSSIYRIPNGTSPYICPNCKSNPCTCWQYVPNTITYPWTGGSSSTFTFPTDPVAAKLFEMLLQGKDVIEHKEEYMQLIEQLPWVKGNNMQVIAVYERLRRLAKLLGIPVVRKKKVEDSNGTEGTKS